MANATETEAIHRTLETCGSVPKKVAGPAFIAPRASDLHSELEAVLGKSQHMGTTTCQGPQFIPTGWSPMQ